ncbi:capsular polysaccharide biosynthesis protein [Mesorhizobium sp. NPDC059025]|uniref:capsular polysaccharide biosynthesis protein n=1 Tax=unclassified Mesorhizobium TaxID=325217 RepID=UPI0036705517
MSNFQELQGKQYLESERGRASWLPREGAELLAFLPTRLRFPLISAGIGATLHSLELATGPADGVIGWGNKPLARIARRYARFRNLPFWTLEDGFLRSVGLGKTGSPSVSMVVDDIGIHFSAHSPSRLEMLLQENTPDTDLTRARDLRAWIVSERLSKYNHLPDHPLTLPWSHRKRVLLVDQVMGDMSIEGAAAGPETFRRMWDQARSLKNVEILVKSHPDVVAGYSRGYLTELASAGGVTLITDAVSSHSVLDAVDEVWTVSSQLGFDALLREKPVITFGLPVYAGWGLTLDHAEGSVAAAVFSRRTRRVSIDEFVRAAFLDYSVYVDPVKRQSVSAEQAVERLISWRRRVLSLRGSYLCIGFSRQKKKMTRRYLEGPWSNVVFTSNIQTEHVEAADHLVLWGKSLSSSQEIQLGKVRKPIIRVEDGFIRSVGLGSDLVSPSSLCFDSEGIYFDALHTSGLEILLKNTNFDTALLNRAKRLRQTIVALGITKYNLPKSRSLDYRQLAGGRAVIMVAEQVPNDASLRFGIASYDSNVELLKAVRAIRPEAFIIYKEHPDLIAGNRNGRTDASQLRTDADLVVGQVNLDEVLHACDEVHVATSLVGFEALLRSRPVWCHGLPFYAGWGLTNDATISIRRQRILELDALIAGTLILYPQYWSYKTNLPCEVEDVVNELHRTKQRAKRSFFVGRRLHLPSLGAER